MKYEPYPQPNPDGSSTVGALWTQAKLDSVGKGCGTTTTMGRELAETYAANPHFYGSTYCCGCSMHRAVGRDGEFVWDGTNERESEREAGPSPRRAGMKLNPGDTERAALIRRATEIRDEIDQIFADATYWNEHTRKPDEPVIDPDPDGAMAKSRVEAERCLAHMWAGRSRPSAERAGK